MRTLALIVGLGAAATSPLADASRENRPLPFISDDYARALGEARARELPLFIEAWAPW